MDCDALTPEPLNWNFILHQPLWPGSDTLAILWDEWLGANENWKESTYAIRLSRTHSHEKIGARRWLTFKQLVHKYDGDTEVAKSIREAKKNDPKLRSTHVKRHPDCPNNPATRLH